MAFRIGMNIAAWVLCAGAVVGAPPVQAAPGAVLPPIPSTGGGPIIGGGDEAAQSRIARQLMSVGNADVQEGDGADAASFIMDSAQVADSRLASAFAPLQRALGCQKVNTSFGARAYRRSDGGGGGGDARHRQERYIGHAGADRLHPVRLARGNRRWIQRDVRPRMDLSDVRARPPP
ncbi:hypothetical protein OSJ30_09270 [Mycobacterium ulcerans]|nr:hypothetical protein [Mycobacterium ulcerans]MEB4374784.1 hypothetical protein [Mycobacterium ulcerans]